MPTKTIQRTRMSYNRLLAIGFLTVILIGSLLLSLPIATRSGNSTPFLNALFTATSATCVTGLVVYDTFSHWSNFGQAVILVMIQIGGIGFMTLISFFFLMFNMKVGLHDRKMIQLSSGSIKLAGIVKLVRRILVGTLIFEVLGAALLSLRFIPDMGVGKGIWYGVFHSVSAFCNAGFDLMGFRKPFSSLTHYAGDPLVNITLGALIIIGGLGFLVWNDIYEKRWKFKSYSLHSKIVLITTICLLLSSWLLFFWLEYHQSMVNFNFSQRVFSSFFQAVTPRTAGFNTLDLTILSESGTLLTILLMFIGGSPGSTAGGIKTSTFAIMLLGIYHLSRGSRQVTLFKKSLEQDIYRRATALLGIYLIAILSASIIIGHVDLISLHDVLFETVSAAATVGLSMGITPNLSVLSKLLLIFLMYGGRLGGFTMMTIFAEKQTESLLKRPTEKILVG